MPLDLTALLAPLAGASPCGEDLEYDPDFVALETLARGKAEQQVGTSVLAAEEADHPEVVRQALALLDRTKDIRIAVILGEAVLRTEGVPAFAQVLGYVRGCLEQYWPHVHPLLDADDDNDPTMRVNATVGLCGNETVLRALRLAHLAESRRLGRFGLRDHLVASGEMPPPAGYAKVDPATIAAAFQDSDPARIAAIRAGVTEARAHLKAIDAIFLRETGSGGPDLAPLDRLLHRVAQTIESYLGAAPEAAPAAAAGGGSEAEADGGGAAPAAAGGRPATVVPGAIATSDDVIRTLDRLVEYYERREPSSPVPLLLKRARRLVNADFVTIIRDMARNGMDQVRTVGGIKDDD